MIRMLLLVVVMCVVSACHPRAPRSLPADKLVVKR